MNVYDFDKTIYDGDCTVDFYFFCLKKHFELVFCIPRQLFGAVRYKLGIFDKIRFKEEFYSFLLKLRDVECDVKEFWDNNENKIKEWYFLQKEETDVVISASPHFLLEEICKRLEIKNLIASEVNKKSGKYFGKNCYGEEKVKRFESEIGGKIDKFYSDSKSDEPMMQKAQEAYLVKGKKIVLWNGVK